MPDDGFERYYQNKLWSLIPAIYRSLDSDSVASGPLREMVNRIGAQAAVLRRSIDRMWADQSIETCDDWVIPYIGDLLATNLVACLDSVGQRRDVAKTIYYRRRKGTVGLLEELASDIASIDVRVVEFFRRLGRTRHSFDPPIGLVALRPDPTQPPAAAVIEGLVGAYTRTPMGGFADLRHAYGASKANSAFDEFFHTADFRRGRPSVGWHGIPRLGAFQWWTETLAVVRSTPVPSKACPGQFTFDPTGRNIPLFAGTRRIAEQFGEHWISPSEWELPVAISSQLWRLQTQQFYPDAVSVFEGGTWPFALMGVERVGVNPELGRFRLLGAPPADGVVHGSYHYGFTSRIGAGPYDQRVLGPLPSAPAPSVEVKGGLTELAQASAGLGAQGSVIVKDSLTYSAPTDLGGAQGLQNIAIIGDNKQRPVVRWDSTIRQTWVINGAPGAELVLQGFHLVGADVVLRGEFSSVRICCSTLDPGTSDLTDPTKTLFGAAADGVPLSATRLFVEAGVKNLVIERSISGPVRTRSGGAIESLTISDSIVQAIADTNAGAFALDDLYDAGGLALKLTAASDPLSKFLHGKLSAAGASLIGSYQRGQTPSDALKQQLVTELNAIIGSGASLYSASVFAQTRLSVATQSLISQTLTGDALTALNQQLLQAGYPVELATQAIAATVGSVSLLRTTILGPMAVHRLDASESILNDLTFAEDEQHGCVRFSAYAEGSVVHQPYESVRTAPQAALFRSRDFGSPDYGRLDDAADAAITWGLPGASILAGAQNGSEMGVFALQKIPLKKRALAQKFQEFMPVSQVPVWIDVT